MKFQLLCCVLTAVVALPAYGQDPQPGNSPQSAAAVKTALTYESNVKNLRDEYYAQLARMDAEYVAKVEALRAALVKDLVALQSETAKQNLDDAANILDAARQYEKRPIVSPYQRDVAPDRRVAVFLQSRPNSDIVERIHILAANGRSLVVNCKYPDEIGSGTWQLDGDQLTYTEKSTARRYGKEPEVTTVTARWDASGKSYSYPEIANEGLNFRSYVNGSGHLIFGNTDFLKPGPASDRETEPEEDSESE